MILTRLMRRDVIRRMLILLHVIVMNIVRFLDRVLDRVLVVYGSWTHISSPADRATCYLPPRERFSRKCNVLWPIASSTTTTTSHKYINGVYGQWLHTSTRGYTKIAAIFFLGKTTAVPSVTSTTAHPQAFPKVRTHPYT
jgi:hypothetical protein